MSTVTKRFEYAALGDIIEFTAPDFVLIEFGRSSSDEAENTQETYWVNECLTAIKPLAPHGNLRILADFSRVDSSEYNSHESNKLYQQMLKDPAICKVAAFGLKTGWQLLMDLIGILAPQKLKTFATEQDARAWLNKP
ncbi:MAG: STAS/SEC14 domain-containing protein [Patescibacteria group bacterium]|jgi:hypothetical protein